MNEFASTENSQGLLKADYGDAEESELSKALKRRRLKLKASRLGAEEEDENG